MPHPSASYQSSAVLEDLVNDLAPASPDKRHKPLVLQPLVPLAAGAPASDKNWLGSHLPPDTSVPHSSCLASASFSGFGCRCTPATGRVLPASSLDLLQGTLQKIHLQRLLPKRSLQSLVLLLQTLYGVLRYSLLRLVTSRPAAPSQCWPRMKPIDHRC
jgi:hypothetical protein